MLATLPSIAEAMPRVEKVIRDLGRDAVTGRRLRSIVVLTGTLALGGTLDRRAVISAACVEVLHVGVQRDDNTLIKAARRAVEAISPFTAQLETFRLGCVLANHCAGADHHHRMAQYGTAFGQLCQSADAGAIDEAKMLAERASNAVPDVHNDAAAILRALPAAYLNWASLLIA